ncbi:hypothetical protein SDC9_169314 [bioreactor metagenome]|uniref:Uncharacterized protein n=1 Tax=bioreactor metagenome TaxID=1076179 RepID=A0A645G7I4_9ZZZZ
MIQFVIDLLDFFLKGYQSIISFIGVKLSDSHHLDLQQFQDILPYYFPDKIFFEGFQSAINMSYHLILIRTFLKALIFIYPVFDEYLFKRSKEKLLLQFSSLYFELKLQKIFRMLTTHPQHFADIHESWFFVVNHTAIRRNTYLAIGKGIQSIDSFIRR